MEALSIKMRVNRVGCTQKSSCISGRKRRDEAFRECNDFQFPNVEDFHSKNGSGQWNANRRPSGKNKAETLFTYIFPRIFFVPMMAFIIQHFIFSPFTPFSFLPTNFFDGLLGLALVSQGDGLDFFDQQESGIISVQQLIPASLTFNVDSRWRVGESYTGGHFVDVLAAFATGGNERFCNIVF